MKIECLMQDYLTRITVDAPNERDAEILAKAEQIKTAGFPGLVRSFKRIQE